MSISEFISVFLNFILFTLTAISIGQIIFKTKLKDFQIGLLGIYILVGTACYGYLGLILGLFGKFNIIGSPILMLFLIVINLKKLVNFSKEILKYFKNLVRDIFKSPINIILLILFLLTLVSLYLSSLQPPYAQDELHYHLPQAREIVEKNSIDLSYGGHPFYGNIPKLMEVLFAVGIAFNGFSMAHLINFLVFVGFLLITFEVIRKNSNLKTSLLSVLFLVFFDDLTWNATTGYIDTATLSYEISALLLLLHWLNQKTKSAFYFNISAILLGFSLSIKYSPLPTAIFILTLLFLNKTKLKEIVKYFLFASVSGGFWYIKNLFMHKNPFYPLYFGHEGYSDEQYKSLVNAIHEFGDKTFLNFFNITKRYLTTNSFFIFASLYLSPIILFFKKDKFFKTLSVYVLLFSFYWFFIATHQIRFLAPALVCSLIILSHLIFKIQEKVLIKSGLAISIIFVVFNSLFLKGDLVSTWNNFWNTKLHVRERQYALGNISESEFLHRQFGCQYDVVSYLKENNITDRVVDNWSVWHAPSVSFYAIPNQFVTYGNSNETSDLEILEKLKQDNISYLYFRESVKERHLKNTDSIVIKSRDQKLPTEKVFLDNSREIFQKDDCYLFKLEN